MASTATSATTDTPPKLLKKAGTTDTNKIPSTPMHTTFGCSEYRYLCER